MMKIVNKISLLAVFALGLAIVGCGAGKDRQSIKPLYETDSLSLGEKPIEVEYWGDIGATTIDAAGIRKFENRLFGWIPIFGDLLELPIDLGMALIPPLPSTITPELPKDASWNDPKLINMIDSLRLAEGSIRIIPPSERGPNYKREKCWFGVIKCQEEGFSFLKEIRVYLIFKDPKVLSDVPKSKVPPQPEVLIARAETDNDYDPDTKTLHFVPSDIDLKTFLSKYGSFDVKIIATGKYPRRKVYLDGRLRLTMGLKLDK